MIGMHAQLEITLFSLGIYLHLNGSNYTTLGAKNDHAGSRSLSFPLKSHSHISAFIDTFALCTCSNAH